MYTVWKYDGSYTELETTDFWMEARNLAKRHSANDLKSSFIIQDNIRGNCYDSDGRPVKMP